MDLGLAALALGDVAIDQDKAAVRNSIPTNLYDPPIGSRSFSPEFLVGVFETAVEFRLDVVGAEFTWTTTLTAF
jgi:hypothetical protein